MTVMLTWTLTIRFRNGKGEHGIEEVWNEKGLLSCTLFLSRCGGVWGLLAVKKMFVRSNKLKKQA